MAALKGAEIESFVRKPDPARRLILVYGPDSGLVRERAEAILRASVDDADDPFALVRLDGDALSASPGRIADEAYTIPLFGGRRAVSVRAGGRNIVPALEPLMADPPKDCRVVVEAGDLKKTSPLRALFEGGKTALAIPCFADSERDIAALIDAELREAKLRIEPDAREALVPLLGGDRAATRSELRKLILYMHGKEVVTFDDVVAVSADASGLALDALIDAAFAGRTAEMETQLAKAETAGTSPGSILIAALRQALFLHKASLAMEDGGSAERALAGIYPKPNFKREPLVKAALNALPAGKLAQIVHDLGEATMQSRKRAALAGSIAARALLSISQSARVARLK